jgi:5'-nucleotidase
MAYHILITNDDGIGSPALRALEVALSPLGRVSIVAPDRERSATSHCITLDEPVPYTQIAPNWYAVQGTPADCVIAALFRILNDRPSIVISGINQGLNVGEDILYSGTVAAASEAAIQGLPAIAVSAAARDNADYKPAAGVAAGLAERVLKEGLPPDVILNVNYPASWNREFRLTRQGRRSRIQNDSGLMSDIDALASGYVSISPLHINRTFPVDASSWLCAFHFAEDATTKGHNI